MSGEVYTVTHDFTPEASDQVKLTEGSSITVVVKKDSGWWLVRTDENQGWVPATHLYSQLKGREDQMVKYPKGMEERFMVVKTYKSDYEDEVTIQMGSVVEVVEKTMDGWWLVRCKGKEGRAPSTNLRRANTAKAQHILEISSQATLEAQMKQAQRSKSPPKASSKKSKKNKKDEGSDKKSKKTLPDVVPSEVEEFDEVLPPPPRRQHSQEKKRHGAFKRLMRSESSRKKSEEIPRRSRETSDKKTSRESYTRKSPRESSEKTSPRESHDRREDSGRKHPREDHDRKLKREDSSKRPVRESNDRRLRREDSSKKHSTDRYDRRSPRENPEKSRRRNIEPQRNPLHLEEYRSIQMLESVISLSEAETENFNNNASYSQGDMTLEALGDKQEEEETTTPPPTQHFTKNPNRTAGNQHHIKAKNKGPTNSQKYSDEEEQDEHEREHKQDSDRTHENFSLAKKDGRPIYVVRANYRACEDTEVDLIAEELVVVMEKTGTGWWYVQAKSGTGWAPNHFLKVPTDLMDENPQAAEDKQLKHLEQLKTTEPAQSTCSAAHKMDQHAPKHTVRHVVKGRPQLFRDGVPATVCPSDFKNETDEESDIGKSVSELRKMFNKWQK